MPIHLNNVEHKPTDFDSVETPKRTTIGIPLDTREPVMVDTPVSCVWKEYRTTLVDTSTSHGFRAQLAAPEGESTSPRLAHGFRALSDGLKSTVHNVRNLTFASQG